MESFADAISYDIARLHITIQECVFWWLDYVKPAVNQIVRAQMRNQWRRNWTPEVQQEAAFYIKLLS